MVAPLNDGARLHDQDLVDRLEAGQPMRDEYDRAPCGCPEEVGGQGIGAGKVEVFAWLVQDEDREVGQQSPRHGHPLALTPGHDAHPTGRPVCEDHEGVRPTTR